MGPASEYGRYSQPAVLPACLLQICIKQGTTGTRPLTFFYGGAASDTNCANEDPSNQVALNTGINNIIAKGGPGACVFFNIDGGDVISTPKVSSGAPADLSNIEFCASFCQCTAVTLVNPTPDPFTPVTICPTTTFTFNVPQFRDNCGVVPSNRVSIDVSGPGVNIIGATGPTVTFPAGACGDYTITVRVVCAAGTNPTVFTKVVTVNEAVTSIDTTQCPPVAEVRNSAGALCSTRVLATPSNPQLVPGQPCQVQVTYTDGATACAPNTPISTTLTLGFCPAP